jgi:hypothetical protein
MSEHQAPKSKKDTEAGKFDTETADPFVNALHKKMRNKKKKMDKITQTEQKVKAKEIVPNEEQKAMLGKKEQITKDMKDVQKIITMYKDAFPDNPAFANAGKKKDNKKKKQEQVAEK